MSLDKDTLAIDFVNRKIAFALRRFTFLDHGYYVMYIPSLRLSAYGSTEEDADNMLGDVVMDDFCENLIQLGEAGAYEYLSKLGWSTVGRDTKRFTNLAYVDKDGILRNFDLPIDTPIQETFVTV